MLWMPLVAPAFMIAGFPCALRWGYVIGQRNPKAAVRWAALLAVFWTLAALSDLLCHALLGADIAGVGAFFWLSLSPCGGASAGHRWTPLPRKRRSPLDHRGTSIQGASTTPTRCVAVSSSGSLVDQGHLTATLRY